ncbi:MAG: integrase/recombinase XerD [Mycobacterium sp.]|jgi:hypothetical protein|nr:integrase/recombinase XerD [Mycobacterium sp.]
MTVRWAKGTTGSGPRRRTVLTVPEFPWVVDLLHYSCTDGREMFSTADRSPARAAAFRVRWVQFGIRRT